MHYINQNIIEYIQYIDVTQKVLINEYVYIYILHVYLPIYDGHRDLAFQVFCPLTKVGLIGRHLSFTYNHNKIIVRKRYSYITGP